MSLDAPRQAMPEPPGTFYTHAVRMRYCHIVSAPIGGAMFGFMGLTLILMRIYAPSGYGPLAGALCIGGMSLAFGLPVLAYPFLSLWGMRRLRGPLQARCEALYGVDLADVPQMGVSPGDELRSYDGDTSYDLGFLSVTPDRMMYYGDRMAFEVLPHQVEGVTIRTHTTFFLHKMPRVNVTWRTQPSADPQVLSFEVRDAATYHGLHGLSEALVRKIEEWRAHAGVGAPERPAAAPGFTGIVGREMPVTSNVSCSMLLVVMLGAIVLGALSAAVGFYVFGKDTARSPAFRYGTIFVVVMANNVLMAWLRRGNRQP